MIRQACILVGGRGTRLGKLTLTTPKPLLEIGNGAVFLDVIIEQVVRQGFDDLVLLAGHLGHLVRERYDRRRFGAGYVRVVVEPELCGTGGALISAQKLLAPRFLLLNGDSFFDINLRALAADSFSHEALIALRRASDPTRYGVAELKGKTITRFVEKNPSLRGAALVNAGIYSLTQSVVHRINVLPCSIETDIFPALAESGRLAGIVCDGYFLDIGLPETLEQGRRELPERRTRPAAFLNSHAVVDIDHGSVRFEKIKLVDGAQDAVRRLNDLGYRVVVMTNQNGLEYTHYCQNDIAALHQCVQEQLAISGAFIDAFYFYTHHLEASLERSHGHHGNDNSCLTLILQAFSDLNIRKDRSFFIGNERSDIDDARDAGISGFLFSDGNLARFLDDLLPQMVKPNRAS